MTRINTNVQSMIAQRVLGQNNFTLNKSLERLSTGLRINRGKDDPAGLIASENLRAEIKSTNAAIANLAEHLRGEISAPANLRGEGEDDCVVPRASAGGDAAVCPTGDVVWEQRRVPLDRLLHQVEARPLDPPRKVGK